MYFPVFNKHKEFTGVLRLTQASKTTRFSEVRAAGLFAAAAAAVAAAVAWRCSACNVLATADRWRNPAHTAVTYARALVSACVHQT